MMNAGTTNETSHTATAVTPSPPLFDAAAMEANAIDTYRPPGNHHAAAASMTTTSMLLTKPVEWVHNPDGTPLIDQNGRPISVDKILATKPLRHELCSRPGPGNRKLFYLSGEGVTRTLNDIFGYDGWNMDIKHTSQVECVKDEKKGRHCVAYTATVRLTHRRSGAYKEDCGAGDAMDRSLGTAVANALKASITDAMKRAARHFGDKLGNSLYQGTFSINKAPNTLQQALDQHEIERANTKFGFPKDQKTTSNNVRVPPSNSVPPPPCAIKGVPPASAIKVTGIRTPAVPTPNDTATANPNRTSVPPPFRPNNDAEQSSKSGGKLLQSKSGEVPPNNQERPPAQQRPTNTNTGRTMNNTNSAVTPHLQAGKAAAAPAVVSAAAAPPSAKQKLETSGLFDLSAFAAAGSPLMMNAQQHASDGGARHPSNKKAEASNSEFDVFDTPRPGTSTGVRPAGGASGLMSGPSLLVGNNNNKRPAPSNATENEPHKKPANNNNNNMNPYLLNPSM